MSEFTSEFSKIFHYTINNKNENTSPDQLSIFNDSNYPDGLLVQKIRFSHHLLLLEKWKTKESTYKTSKHLGGLQAPNCMHYYLAKKKKKKLRIYINGLNNRHIPTHGLILSKTCAPPIQSQTTPFYHSQSKNWTSIITLQLQQLWQPGEKNNKNHPQHHVGIPPSGTALNFVFTMNQLISPNGNKMALPTFTTYLKIIIVYLPP